MMDLFKVRKWKTISSRIRIYGRCSAITAICPKRNALKSHVMSHKPWQSSIRAARKPNQRARLPKRNDFYSFPRNPRFLEGRPFHNLCNISTYNQTMRHPKGGQLFERWPTFIIDLPMINNIRWNTFIKQFSVHWIRIIQVF